MYTFPTMFLVLLVLSAVLVSTSLPAAEIYHWVDENGVAHYSQYRPPDNTPNVSTQELAGADSSRGGEVEDVYNVEAHEKRMAGWREERDKKRADAREQKTKAAQQQSRQYPEPDRSYSRPYWYPPVHNRPPQRPPIKPRPPTVKPGPPSSVKPRGVSR